MGSMSTITENKQLVDENQDQNSIVEDSRLYPEARHTTTDHGAFHGFFATIYPIFDARDCNVPNKCHPKLFDSRTYGLILSADHWRKARSDCALRAE